MLEPGGMKKTEDWFYEWQAFPGEFPRFNRKWSDVEQALKTAIKFRF